jgi:hypothetical protein
LIDPTELPARSLCQFVKQCSGILQIKRVEAFGERSAGIPFLQFAPDQLELQPKTRASEGRMYDRGVKEIAAPPWLTAPGL